MSILDKKEASIALDIFFFVFEIAKLSHPYDEIEHT